MARFSVTVTVPQLCHREEAYRQRLSQQRISWLKKYQRKVIWARRKRKTKKGFLRLLPGISITLGSVMLANALWPIMAYFAFTSPNLQRNELVSALPEVSVIEESQTVAVANAANQNDMPKIIHQNLDFTNLSNWFPDSGLPEVASNSWENEVDHYTLNIPSLNIHHAEVKIGGMNLDESLVQYPGTAEPGRAGAPVIFGHSVLRQFYNPSEKNPRRYFSIFSKIMTMKTGDQIEIEYDGITYTYSVLKKVEVKPEDLFILQQDYDNKFLKLITCVPEGTYLRRGVVIAQLETAN